MVSTPDAIQIRPLRTIAELKAVEELQVEVWGCSEREVLPSLTLIPLLDIGGVLLGAFDGEELVGFVIGFPGFDGGQAILHSDMLAVRSIHRSTGLGYRLKLEQRSVALANGIEKITWTFDPLQAANAHLNFRKLGVIADCYKINYYGETSSALHRTGTDRLWVTWLLRSDHVTRRISVSGDKSSVNAEERPALISVGPDGEPVSAVLDVRQNSWRIEIPNDINAMVDFDPARANRWREATRAQFTAAFAANFAATDFFKAPTSTRAGFYILTRTN
ncbi:MAG TPA: GNAT family N-acetyltransferase [Pyrinomonadaceae bacterium]|nr:GNAT family N-acetyltransferase [Pyrinomonadaceae bacterium]